MLALKLTYSIPGRCGGVREEEACLQTSEAKSGQRRQRHTQGLGVSDYQPLRA